MNERMLILLLSLCVSVLLCAVIAQRISFQRGTRKALTKMTRRLEEILNGDGDGNLMVFTDQRALKELAAEINRMLEEQRKVKADFRRLEHSSRNMLSNISHDIKTPMTVILGYLEIMRLKGPDQAMLRKVEQKAEQVLELMDQFFTLAKLESGDQYLELVRVDLCEMARETVLDFYDILTEKKFQVEVRIPEGAVYVQGDREALGRILWNLISNAVRYGLDGAYLGMFFRTEGEEVFLDVVDHGKGIDPIFAETVFDRLFTMEDSRNRRIQGNGLGLTIARDLARRLGGDITLKSEPSVRTVFTLKLKRVQENGCQEC